ncbi:serine hydroxymethyltransferase [Gammaproteobacteria bacterium]|nr:serine hydroxymethyltransferase [Gammaproteobacteria bacterium]
MRIIDEQIQNLIEQESQRQSKQVVLIASENFASEGIKSAQGSVLTNKYAEGYPNARYYGGCQVVDEVEILAIERVKALYNSGYANVQPHSGSDANMAVLHAILSPGDTILGMALDAGGHLTHGHKASVTGKLFNAISYGLDEKGLIDYAEVERLARQHQPRLIIAGFSAYSKIIDWAFFARVAKEVGAVFLADMAHVSGLVAAGVYPSPLPHADIVTSTTHKTLRGPRGGMILAHKESTLTKKIQKSVFPGMQGGPMMHTIAAKAICFFEAMQPDFIAYQKQVILNTIAMAKAWQEQGFEVVSGQPDIHMFLVSLEGSAFNGAQAQQQLEALGVVCNKNSIPNDPLPPQKTSGLRLGLPAMTTRGIDQEESYQLGKLCAQVCKEPSDTHKQQLQEFVDRLAKEKMSI